MSDLRELYQEVILDHGKNPRNFRKLEQPQCHANGHNPLCGDRIEVYLDLDAEGKIADLTFDGAGCAICTASASLMTQVLKGKSREEAEQIFEGFHHMVTAEDPDEGRESLGKLEVFAGVRKYPVRVKCATLPWHTMHAALTHPEVESVTTE